MPIWPATAGERRSGCWCPTDLDTPVVRFAAHEGRAHDSRGGGDHRLVGADAALSRERGPDRAAPERGGLPDLRPRRAAAAAHAPRVARRARPWAVGCGVREALAPGIRARGCGSPLARGES